MPMLGPRDTFLFISLSLSSRDFIAYSVYVTNSLNLGLLIFPAKRKNKNRIKNVLLMPI